MAVLPAFSGVAVRDIALELKTSLLTEAAGGFEAVSSIDGYAGFVDDEAVTELEMLSIFVVWIFGIVDDTADGAGNSVTGYTVV